jgi:hypothetical protein
MLYPSMMFRLNGVDPQRAGEAWRTIPALMEFGLDVLKQLRFNADWPTFAIRRRLRWDGYADPAVVARRRSARSEPNFRS